MANNNSIIENNNEELTLKTDLEIETTTRLRYIGIQAHVKGYNYLRSSIIKTVKEPEMINAVTKWLYPEIAKEFSTNWVSVERSIRHAIKSAWENGNPQAFETYFGYSIYDGKKKPSNSQFIATIADDLRLMLKAAGKL